MPPSASSQDHLDNKEEPQDLQPALGLTDVAPLSREDIATGLRRAEREKAARLEANFLRRHGDAELVSLLRADGFAGPDYDVFENELARYGLSVMGGWLMTGHIFRLVARRKRPQEPSDTELYDFATSPEARDDLASHVVVETLAWFRQKALVEGQWSPEGGATLTTYFMGACVLTFPNELRRRRNQNRDWGRQDAALVRYDLDRGPIEDPGTIVAGNLRVLEDLSRLSQRQRRTVAARLADFSEAEIAEMFGEESERAVEGVIYRWRLDEKARLRDQERGH